MANLRASSATTLAGGEPPGHLPGRPGSPVPMRLAIDARRDALTRFHSFALRSLARPVLPPAKAEILQARLGLAVAPLYPPPASAHGSSGKPRAPPASKHSVDKPGATPACRQQDRGGRPALYSQRRRFVTAPGFSDSGPNAAPDRTDAVDSADTLSGNRKLRTATRILANWINSLWKRQGAGRALVRWLDGKPLAALGPARVDRPATGPSGHAGPEAMPSLAL